MFFLFGTQFVSISNEVQIKKTNDKIPQISMHGALAGSRTPNLLIRSQVLYPIKLQARRKSIPPQPMSEKSSSPY